MTTEGVNIRGYVLEVYRDPEDGSWVADVPDLPGCVAAGETPTEAIELAEDAITAWIEAAEADARPIPAPRPVEDEYSGRFVLRPPKALHRRLAAEARREGVSLNTYCVVSLAEAVGLAAGRAVWGATDMSARFAPEAQYLLLSGTSALASQILGTFSAHELSGLSNVPRASLVSEGLLVVPAERGD